MTESRKGLMLAALGKCVMGLVFMALLLFPAAGTMDYRGGWLLLGLLFIPMIVMGIVLLIKSPELLRRRLDSKEKRSNQRGVIGMSGLIFIVGFVVAGIDYRYGWSHIGDTGVYSVALLFLVGYALYGEVLRENVWLSRTVKVESEQEVISTGLYGIVRHPMYTATLLMFLSMPVILGSLWSLAVFMIYIPIIVVRLLDEEQLLRKELKGYDEYCQKVRWRLLPYLW